MLGFRVSGFRIRGFGFWGSGFGVQDLGLRACRGLRPFRPRRA